MAGFTFFVDHITISVKNLERSCTFYQSVFGLEEIKNETQKSNIRWFRLGTSQELHIVEVQNIEKIIPKGAHFALAVDNLDRFREKLYRLGIEYSDWPGNKNACTTRPDDIQQIYLQDPDAYWIEINDHTPD